MLFSLEELSFYFPIKTLVRSFYCAMIAAMTLKVRGRGEDECRLVVLGSCP